MYYFLLQTNTFQGIVVTDLSESYAVYIYNCHDMQFSGSASIGFTSHTYELFANHRLSGYNARNIGCVNSGQSDWVNLVYKLTREDLQPIQPTGTFILVFWANVWPAGVSLFTTSTCNVLYSHCMRNWTKY